MYFTSVTLLCITNFPANHSLVVHINHLSSQCTIFECPSLWCRVAKEHACFDKISLKKTVIYVSKLIESLRALIWSLFVSNRIFLKI